MPGPESVPLRDGRSAIVRRADAGDAEALIAHLSAVGAEKVYLMTERFDRTAEEVRKFVEQHDGVAGEYLVAVVEGTVAGSANFLRGKQSKNAHTAELGVAVRKEWRGLGIGAALMEAGIRWARSVGVRKLTLGVFATNERAVRLYRRLGFVEEGRLRGQVILDGVPVDELLMALWV
jgi:RimJ/RimL family protein N-acetyltransferase